MNGFLWRIVLLMVLGTIACSESVETPERPPVTFQQPVAATGTVLTGNGRIYYVAAEGTDANPGSMDEPWGTIQHAADSMQAGDTAVIRAGTYNEAVTLTHSGTADNPITFTAFTGETVVMDGNNRSLYAAFQMGSDDPGLLISDIIIDGFMFQNYSGFGIVAWSINDRLTLTNLDIHDNGDEGIRLSNSDGSQVSHVRLQNNEGGFDCTPILPGDSTDPGCTNLNISDFVAIDNGTQGDTATDALAIERGSEIVIERAQVSGGVGDGFDIKASDVMVSQIVAHNTRNNVKLWGKNSTLVNALLYDAEADANLVLTAGGSYTITNVTIANMTETAYLVVAGDTSGRGDTPVRIANAILYNDNPANEGTLLYFGPDGVFAVVENSLYYNPYRTSDVICADFPPYNGQCFNVEEINAGGWALPANRYANPLFVDGAGKDFYLSENSPAVNGGTVNGAPDVDLAGCRRDEVPDIGAYEWADCVFLGCNPGCYNGPPASSRRPW